jgi:hypothetical protein
MSPSAWERHALNSIKDELAGSAPELAAQLSAFTRMASGKVMPKQERITARHRVRQRLGAWGPTVLMLWALTTAALIAVVVVIGAGHRGTCTQQTPVMTCAGPTPAHSQGSPSHGTTTGQVPRQQTAGIPQAGP